MRASLQDSLASRRVADVQYVKGSTVLCCACLKPLYVLQRSIFSGDKASRTVDAYRPVTVQDLAELEARVDVPGVAAMLRSWDATGRRQHCESVPSIGTGAAAICPACDRSWVRVRALEAAEVLDRAYVWELVTVAPREPIDERTARQWLVPPQSH